MSFTEPTNALASDTLQTAKRCGYPRYAERGSPLPWFEGERNWRASVSAAERRPSDLLRLRRWIREYERNLAPPVRR